MRALRLHDRHDLRIEDVASPKDLKPRDVLVRASLCGICGSDLHEYAHGPISTTREPHVFTGAKLPQILGHEFTGTVVAIGSEVNRVAPGHRVSIQPQMAPPDDYYGARGLYQLSPKVGVVGLSWAWGGMAEFAVVNDYNVYSVPDVLTDLQASLVEPAAVAVHAVDRAGVSPGLGLLISGFGPIGALCALAARVSGVETLIISETNPIRLKAAGALVPGAILVNPARDSLREAVQANTDEGIGLHAAIECAGVGPALEGCIASVRRGGTVVQVGLQTQPVKLDLLPLTFGDIILRGSICYPCDSWPKVMNIIASGAFPVERIVTSIVPLDEAITQGFDRLLDPQSTELKVVLDVSGPT